MRTKPSTRKNKTKKPCPIFHRELNGEFIPVFLGVFSDDVIRTHCILLQHYKMPIALLLSFIIQHGGENGVVQVSRDTLTKLTGLTAQQQRTHFKRMEEHNLIKIQYVKSQSNVYRLNQNKLFQDVPNICYSFQIVQDFPSDPEKSMRMVWNPNKK